MRKRNKIIWIGLILLLLIGTVMGARVYVNWKIKNSLRSKLALLRESGITVDYTKVKVNLWTGKVSADEVMVKVNDKIGPYLSVSIPLLELQAVRLVPFVTHRNLSIKEVTVSNPQITLYRTTSFVKIHTSTLGNKKVLEGVEIDKIEIPNLNLSVLRQDHPEDTLTATRLDLQVFDFQYYKESQPGEFAVPGFIISDAETDISKGEYQVAIEKITYDERQLRIDSVDIHSALSERLFMKNAGVEKDRFDLFVNYITATHAGVEGGEEAFFKLVDANIQFDMEVFRDKRYPNVRRKDTQLPIKMLRQIPFKFQLDTLQILDSRVQYKEFPEAGDSVGSVTFEKLNASVASLDNTPRWTGATTVDVNTRLMGGGYLQSKMTMPGDSTLPYTVEGYLRDMDLRLVNKMMEPAAGIRIESGDVKEIKFSFYYNDYRSDGKLEMDYENLKVVALKNDRKNEADVNKFKTLVINTFLVKKNSHQKGMPRLSGDILFVRDRKKSIFNYWWKSIYSGIKSVYCERCGEDN
ncbi:MAG: DUF748 domain-containing protein [Cyclobacteriaceae bacterium]|nr:DUF748 domain-containing protein [Cyclobacteriaceae bacterium]